LELDSLQTSQKILQNKKKVMEFIIDEILFKVSNEYVRLWVAIEAIDKIILGIRISVYRKKHHYS
jgi:transposase-like protein